MLPDYPEHDCDWKKTWSRKIPDGHAVRVLHETSLDACKFACEDNLECRSIDFQRGAHLCILNNVTLDSFDSLKRNRGFLNYEKSCPEGKQ